MSSPYKDWYEDDDTASPSMTGSSLLDARFPSARARSIWWLATLAFAGLWIAQSWTAVGTPTTIMSFRHIGRDVFSLLVALAVCFGTLRFWQGRAHKSRSDPVHSGGGARPALARTLSSPNSR
jgi:hypothetical protein